MKVEIVMQRVQERLFTGCLEHQPPLVVQKVLLIAPAKSAAKPAFGHCQNLYYAIHGSFFGMDPEKTRSQDPCPGFPFF